MCVVVQAATYEEVRRVVLYASVQRYVFRQASGGALEQCKERNGRGSAGLQVLIESSIRLSRIADVVQDNHVASFQVHFGQIVPMNRTAVCSLVGMEFDIIDLVMRFFKPVENVGSEPRTAVHKHDIDRILREYPLGLKAADRLGNGGSNLRSCVLNPVIHFRG